MTDEDGSRYEKYIPYPLIATVFAYMVWVRTFATGRSGRSPYSIAVTENGVIFSANDSWYHIRTIKYLVENFPAVFPFDPWTAFPYGSAASSGFGGLFDQITATVLMIVTLGSPSARQVEMAAAFAPVFFGAATAVPVYLLAKKLTDRWVALLAAFSLALFGGQFLNRTTFANVQHQSAEAFFVAVAVLGFVVAIERTYAEKPTFAHFRDRDWSGLRKPVGGAVLGGIAYGAYVLTWPAAIYLAFTLGLFVVVQMARDHMNGRSTEYIGIMSAIVFLVSSVVVLVYVLLLGLQYRLSGAAFSAMQPLVLAGVGVGALFLHAVSSYLRKNEYDKKAFPAVVAALFIIGLGFLWLTGLISLFRTLIKNMFSFGLLASEGALTVGEIQPPSLTNAVQAHGFLILVAAIGIAFLIWEVVRNDSPVELAVLFWSVNMFTAYFTQARFGYYIAVAAAVLVAYTVYRVVDLVDLEDASWESLEDVKQVKGYQIVALALIVFLFIPVNVVAISPGMQPAWNSVSAGGDGAWQQQSMPWLADNTPEVSMGYNEGWSVPEDGDFDYNVSASPLEGDYGVMSWWDYGHWITHIGKRIPNANPFQEGNIVSSLFFTAQSEERANLLLEALPSVESGGALEGMSNEELREIVENQNRQEKYEDTRYVVIDDQMAAGKFGAIATWTDFGQEQPYFERRNFVLGQGQQINQTLPAYGGSYDSTMLSRLYFEDANNMSNYRLVHETESYSLIAGRSRQGRAVSGPRLQLRANYNNTDALGGNITLPDLNRLPDNRMLQVGGGTFLYDIRAEASVKTFERVEGATITGHANVTSPEKVIAAVRMRTTNTDRTFDYTRGSITDENGNFSITVPYPTEDDVSVEEGGTDASVEALGPYNVYVGENVSLVQFGGGTGVVGSEEQTLVNVTETDVYMGNTIEAELEKFNESEYNVSEQGGVDINIQDGSGGGSGGGQQGGDGTGTDGGSGDGGEQQGQSSQDGGGSGDTTGNGNTDTQATDGAETEDGGTQESGADTGTSTGG